MLCSIPTGRRRRGPNDFAALRAELIHDAGRQRNLRTDDSEIGVNRLGGREVIRSRETRRHLCDPRISRRRIERRYLRALRQFPTQRMLASARTNHQDFHFGKWKYATLKMSFMQSRYDIVVVGAGHAGCEAARACARLGLRTAMITMNIDLIAQMSCNPAIGGIAKGHLVREIDALGGVMGEVTDAVGIQFRLLNTSRGPAVWSPRAQCDKKQYRIKMREVLEREPNLRILQAEVAQLVIERARVTGVLLRDGRTISADSVVVTTGTFLNGLAHVGEMKYSCGRNGEAPSNLLGDQLRGLGLAWTRLKTGTPPRLDGRTIDWSQFEAQNGDRFQPRSRS